MTPGEGGGRDGRRPGGGSRPPAAAGSRRPPGAGTRSRDAGRRPPSGGLPRDGWERGGWERGGWDRGGFRTPPGRSASASPARGSSGPGRSGPGRSGPGRPGSRDTRPRKPPRQRTGLRRGSPSRRLHAALLCVAFALSLVAGRLVQLQGIDGAHYRIIAQSDRLRTISDPAQRGSITTADGTILAMTVPQDTVFADPAQITGKTPALTALARQKVANAVAGPLGMTPAAVVNLIDHWTSPEYVVLATAVPAVTANRIMALNEPGINDTPTLSRAYPNGDLAANVVGFTNTSGPGGDLRGVAGIEESFNTLLAGRDGQEQIETSTTGQPIPMPGGRISPVVPGGSVRLTLLASLQYDAQQACAARVKATGAANCTIVVMQPSTGKILALAQYPSFDPAQVSSVASTADLPVSAVFPPGSTAKVITVAAALEHGGQTISSPYTVPDSIVVDGFPFHDADWHPTEHLTLAGILAQSSNVGMVQVVQHVSPQIQYRYYRAFGLATPSSLPLPATSAGILPAPSKWWGDQRYTLSFGQGVAATAVQMASVYATIANGGVRVTPSIVAGTTDAKGSYRPAARPASHRVIQATTARDLISILQQVPPLDATLAAQPWGVIPGYSVAAKTGTAQVWDAKAGCLCAYGASYIGMAPATNPKLVVAVNIQDPHKGSYYGNAAAGPAFYDVMRFALQTLKIPPDHGKRPDVRLTAP